jgi:hypothetical protein
MGQVSALGDGIELERLGRNDWRAVDTHAVSSDPRRIIGFIERLARGRYEVVWLSEPPRWAYVASLKSAIDAIFDISLFTGTIESTRANDVHLSTDLAHG